MLDLAELRRQQYAAYHPTFHKPAEGAREAQRPYFHRLVSSERHIVLVHDDAGGVDGFITGQIFPPPPVYDPGGPGCLVDDFVVAPAERWETVGPLLVDELAAESRSAGAVELIVVCAPEDQPKYEMLGAAGLRTVSEWLLRAL
ncbi:MAG: GNAT family N-acetyltransferase [Candidatus Dormibacteraeota bacterium]|nr:GNAT family N-acetyltransferase [Candidatus Dormibacteraeota bacterium]